MQLHITQRRRLNPRKGEKKTRIEFGDRSGLGGLSARRSSLQVNLRLDLCKREGHGARVAETRESIDPWAARITEPQQLGDLVVRLTGCVVQRAANQRVAPCTVARLGQIKMRVATRDDQRQGLSVRKLIG